MAQMIYFRTKYWLDLNRFRFKYIDNLQLSNYCMVCIMVPYIVKLSEMLLMVVVTY